MLESLHVLRYRLEVPAQPQPRGPSNSGRQKEEGSGAILAVHVIYPKFSTASGDGCCSRRAAGAVKGFTSTGKYFSYYPIALFTYCLVL